MPSELPDPGAFGAAFEEFMEAMMLAATRPKNELAVRLNDHLGVHAGELPATTADFHPTDHPNLQLALDAVLAGAELLGFTSRHGDYVPVGLNELISGQGMAGPIAIGPVRYSDVEIGDGRVVRCVSAGVYLARRDGAPIALVLSRGDRPFGDSALRLEGCSPADGAISALLRDLRAAMREHNVFRSKIISLHQTEHGEARVIYHALPQVARGSVILPAGTLERLERQALGVAEQADRLRAGGRHLKRGVLLHGPPGTGKTLSVNYLIGAMPGRTTILLTGRGLGLIEEALAIARELVPATVVFEDVDLVAAERTFVGAGHGVLFELLNQMEGLQEDADLLFLLTTNRPDLVEPALAARPGRVDLALEVPLPDADLRRRLVRLYAGDAALDADTVDDLVARSDGVTGAFIRELMRQAALRAALAGAAQPSAADVSATLDDLLDERSALTRRLLGEPGAEPPTSMVRAMSAAGLPIPPELFDED